MVLPSVMQAAAIGESGQVLVLDMGEPVKIVDLARDLIRLSGRSVAQIPIVFSGLRPGEKLFEELLADGDATLPTPVERLRIARLDDQPFALKALLDWLTAPQPSGNTDLRSQIASVVREYRSVASRHAAKPDDSAS